MALPWSYVAGLIEVIAPIAFADGRRAVRPAARSGGAARAVRDGAARHDRRRGRTSAWRSRRSIAFGTGESLDPDGVPTTPRRRRRGPAPARRWQAKPIAQLGDTQRRRAVSGPGNAERLGTGSRRPGRPPTAPRVRRRARRGPGLHGAGASGPEDGSRGTSRGRPSDVTRGGRHARVDAGSADRGTRPRRPRRARGDRRRQGERARLAIDAGVGTAPGGVPAASSSTESWASRDPRGWFLPGGRSPANFRLGPISWPSMAAFFSTRSDHVRGMHARPICDIEIPGFIVVCRRAGRVPAVRDLSLERVRVRPPDRPPPGHTRRRGLRQSARRPGRDGSPLTRIRPGHPAADRSSRCRSSPPSGRPSARRFWSGSPGAESCSIALLPPVLLMIVQGQLDMVFAVVAVLGLRWPALWAVPLLTKITPGIGIVWFLVRREWRSLAIADRRHPRRGGRLVRARPRRLGELGLDAAPGGVPTGIPSSCTWTCHWTVRLPIALAVIVWGARTNCRWMIPVAMTDRHADRVGELGHCPRRHRLAAGKRARGRDGGEDGRQGGRTGVAPTAPGSVTQGGCIAGSLQAGPPAIVAGLRRRSPVSAASA